jgi:hypothetical protein
MKILYNINTMKIYEFLEVFLSKSWLIFDYSKVTIELFLDKLDPHVIAFRIGWKLFVQDRLDVICSG